VLALNNHYDERAYLAFANDRQKSFSSDFCITGAVFDSDHACSKCDESDECEYYQDGSLESEYVPYKVAAAFNLIHKIKLLNDLLFQKHPDIFPTSETLTIDRMASGMSPNADRAYLNVTFDHFALLKRLREPSRLRLVWKQVKPYFTTRERYIAFLPISNEVYFYNHVDLKSQGRCTTKALGQIISEIAIDAYLTVSYPELVETDSVRHSLDSYLIDLAKNGVCPVSSEEVDTLLSLYNLGGFMQYRTP
jgi:hypothetical protein